MMKRKKKRGTCHWSESYIFSIFAVNWLTLDYPITKIIDYNHLQRAGVP